MAAVKSLGLVGNAWAWQTPSVAVHASEERAVRSMAAAALLQLFIANPDPIRQEAANQLLVVAAPETPELEALAASRTD